MKVKTKQPLKAKRSEDASQKLNGRARAASNTAARWKQQCAELTKERDELRRQIADLRAQRAEYSQIICDFVYKGEPPEIDEDEIESILARIDEAPSFQDLIYELAGPEAKHEKPGGTRKKAAAAKNSKKS
jgi:chromosome segregation ATPase